MSRKGVTPVVATSLLILIAISAVTASAVFLRDTTDDIQDSVNDQLSEEEMRENSEISVDYAYNNSDGDIAIVVRNSGQYALAVEEDNEKRWNLYSEGEPVNFDYSSASGPDVIIDPGGSKTLDSNVDYPSSSYKTLDIEGPYGVSATVLCENSGGNEDC